jgi:hypothetical protein
MRQRTRRDFLTDVGKGMVIAGLGPAVAGDLGFGPAFAAQEPATLSFGRDLDPLVNLMQDTPPARILPLLVRRLNDGTELRQIVAAAALANARTFGGTDYVGFHTMMAISPSYHMAQELPAARRALPVLKVLFRNSSRIHERPNPSVQVLRQVTPGELPAGQVTGEVLRTCVRNRELNDAEVTLVAAARNSAEDAFNAVLFPVEDAADVHRVVMPYRAWDLMGIIGREQAHVLLRQSVRYCINTETPNSIQHFGSVRTLVPRLLDQHRLLGRPRGTRQPDDAWVERMSRTIFEGTPERSADAVAAALAEGMTSDAVGEAITLAANQLVLRDNGRPQNQSAPNRPAGSVHGDSIGVHGCDSANAWRNMARVSNDRNRVVCLILGGWQVAHDRASRGGDFLTWEPYPRAEARERVTAREPDALLRQTEEAIRANDQALASAAAHRYGELGHAPRAMFDLLLRYAISEDGALHAEKFYRTASEEYAATRPAFRWRHVVALARVTASAHGQPAPGVAEATRLLGA